MSGCESTRPAISAAVGFESLVASTESSPVRFLVVPSGAKAEKVPIIREIVATCPQTILFGA